MKKRILIPLICVIACMVALFTYLMVATNYKKVYTYEDTVCSIKASVNPKLKSYEKVSNKVYDKLEKFLNENKKSVTLSGNECYLTINEYDKNSLYAEQPILLETKNCSKLTIIKTNGEFNDNLYGMALLQSYTLLFPVYPKCSVKYVEYPLMKSKSKVILYYYNED